MIKNFGQTVGQCPLFGTTEPFKAIPENLPLSLRYQIGGQFRIGGKSIAYVSYEYNGDHHQAIAVDCKFRRHETVIVNKAELRNILELVREVKSRGIKASNKLEEIMLASIQDLMNSGPIVPAPDTRQETKKRIRQINKDLGFMTETSRGATRSLRQDATSGRSKGDLSEQSQYVKGSADPLSIRRVMNRKKSGIRACYENALRHNGRLSGKLVISFEINLRGRLKNLSFGGSLSSHKLERCIRRIARSWRFSRPEEEPVYVDYPIVFTPSD